MGRIIGIDFGMERIGLAVTDPLKIVVSPLGTYQRGEIMDYLEAYCMDEEVEKFVVGDPFPDHVFDPELKREIDRFIKTLKRCYPEISIDRHDESYSSEDAKQIIRKSGTKRKKRRDKGLVDQVSAVLILQDYLGHLV